MSEIKEYNCQWSELPDNLLTKTGLKKLGYVPIGKPVAQINIYSKSYELYDKSNVEKIQKSNTKNNNKEKKIKKDKKVYDWLAIEDDWKLNKDKYVILDTETTGVFNDDEIIQLSIIDLHGNVLYNQYFKAIKDSHWGAYKVHKISKAFLADKPTWTECWSEIRSILKDKTILIHNDIFDKRLIEQTCSRYNIAIDFELKTLCTMRYTEYRYNIKKLEEVIKFLQIDFSPTQLHNSLVDCFMCLHVVNPNAEVFKIRKIASDYFEKVCGYKILNGDKDGRKKGLDWLKRDFNLINTSIDINYLGLKICKEIINKLQPSIEELKNKDLKINLEPNEDKNKNNDNNNQLSEKENEYYELFLKYKDIQKIADIKKVKIDKVKDVLLNLYAKGININIELSQPHYEKTILNIYTNTDWDGKLKTIKAQLPDDCTYDTIKAVIAIYNRNKSSKKDITEVTTSQKVKQLKGIIEQMKRNQNESFLEYVFRLIKEGKIKKPTVYDKDSSSFLNRLTNENIIKVPKLCYTRTDGKNIALIVYTDLKDEEDIKGRILFCEFMGYLPEYKVS